TNGDGGRKNSQRRASQDQRVPSQRRSSHESDELVHRAVQRRREGGRPVELDADDPRRSAGTVLIGEDPVGYTSGVSWVLSARLVDRKSTSLHSSHTVI